MNVLIYTRKTNNHVERCTTGKDIDFSDEPYLEAYVWGKSRLRRPDFDGTFTLLACRLDGSSCDRQSPQIHLQSD